MKEDRIIDIQGVKKIYRLGKERVVALDDVSFQLTKGEITCIFGTSGSGKSTLLNQLAGLEKPDAGKVEILGVPLPKLNEDQLATFRQKHMGFVFQSYNLLPFLTAVENVAMPLMFRGISEKKRHRRAKKMLEQVGLGDRIHHFPSQMSGGQQQRVGIARAFVAKPAVLFADEPTGNLDSKTRVEVMDLILGFVKKYKQTIVLVTHDPDMAIYADRIITLVDGKIIKDEKGARHA